MLGLIRALLLHRTTILVGKLAGLLFVALTAVAARISGQEVKALTGRSQATVIVVAACFAFVFQAYCAAAEDLARQRAPSKALRGLCEEVYRIFCGRDAHVTGIRVTAFLPRFFGRRLVSVSRFSQGVGEERCGIWFKVGEGTVGMAYQLNQIVSQDNFPDPIIDREAYIKDAHARSKISRRRLEKIHVHSRSFLSMPIRYFDERSKAAAVICLDSSEPSLGSEAKRTRTTRLVENATFLFCRNP